MFQYRQVLVRLRQGDSDRNVARSPLMGRPKVVVLRAVAISQGWLTLEAPLPDDATIAALIGRARRARSTLYTLEPYRRTVPTLGSPPTPRCFEMQDPGAAEYMNILIDPALPEGRAQG